MPRRLTPWQTTGHASPNLLHKQFTRKTDLAQAWENRENANKNVKKAKWRREQDQA